jgi:hypothetical protein
MTPKSEYHFKCGCDFLDKAREEFRKSAIALKEELQQA